jgi:hypothetical protein
MNRKMTVCLLVFLCSLAAHGQPLQWSVVKSIVLLNQTASIPQTTLFTPTQAGVFRLSAEIVPASTEGIWTLEVFWKDRIRTHEAYSCLNTCISSLPEFLNITMAVSKDSPIQYATFPPNDVGGFDLVIVLEQLK